MEITGKIVATSSESGKIIDNTSCYIVTVLKSEEAKNAKINDKVKVRINNNVEISTHFRGKNLWSKK